jgi:hypothetical protein
MKYRYCFERTVVQVAYHDIEADSAGAAKVQALQILGRSNEEHAPVPLAWFIDEVLVEKCEPSP